MNPDILIKDLYGILVFTLCGKKCCISMKWVHYIVNPCDPQLIIQDMGEGISQLNFGGYVSRFIDLNKALNLGKNERNDASRIIIANISGSRFSFLVEKVIEVITLTEKDIECKLKYIKDADEKYTGGSILYKDNSFILPDYVKLIDVPFSIKD